MTMRPIDHGLWSTARGIFSEPIRWLNRVTGVSANSAATRAADGNLSPASQGLRGRRVRDVMRPRTEIVAIPADASSADVRQIVRSERYSRYPVYRDNLDDVIGVFLAKDLWQYEDEEHFTFAEHVRKVPYLPDTLEAERALDMLRGGKAHMAVVLDEFGGTAGIVTMEDLIEEVIGDISDEYDSVARLSVEMDGVLELDASMSLADARADYHVDIPEGDWNTLGGFVFGQMGSVPKVGDRVTITAGELEVVAMDGRRVAAVRVLKTPAPAPDATAAAK